MLVSESMDISNYSCISQMQEGIVYCGMVRGRGVKNGEVGVTRGGAIEVRMGEGTGVEWGSISRGEFRSFSLQCDTIPDGVIPDESRNFFLSVLIDEDKGVVMRVVSIIFIPSFPRMDDIFVITDGDVRWSTESLKECFWLLFTLGVVWVNEVGEGRDVGEVRDAIVLMVCDRETDRSIVFGHCLDEGSKVFCDHIDVVIYRWVVCFVTDDGLTKSNGVVDLGLGGVYCLKDQDSNSFNLGRGRGEVREVFLDLTRCGVGFLLVNISFQC